LLETVPGLARALGRDQREEIVRSAEGQPEALLKAGASAAGRQLLLFPPLTEPRTGRLTW